MMATENYRRLEDKIDKIFDQLSIIQQNVVELRTERVNTCKDIDLNKEELAKTNAKVSILEELLENLNVKVMLLGGGAGLLMAVIMLVASWLLNKN